ncbi:MAG TPA: hypothetical protein VFG91_07685 [Woeseiaceae bacterium]|nr:hypothetical protein [Woeseiaceae bacterium]
MISPARVLYCSMRLLPAVLLLSGPASASDEVDYSAPYMTLEDGKLVTKYPAKPHTKAATAAGVPDSGGTANGAASPDPGGAVGVGPGPDAATGNGFPKPLLAAGVAAGAFAAAAVLLSWRRRKPRRA